MRATIENLRLSGSRDGFEPFWTDRRAWRASWAFVLLGIVLRVLRYALNYPLWGDEGFLAANLIDRDFAALMKPLDFVQVCPILFLWIEKCLVIAFGFSVWSLRAVPTVSAVISLLVFRHLATRILKGPAMVIAVGVVAVGYYPIRHGGEVKPYATDFLAAVGLIAIAVEWMRRPDQSRWLWLLVGLGPLAVAISFPAIFVVSGLGLALLWQALKDRRVSALAPVLLYGVASSLMFLLLLKGVTASQSESVMDTMQDYWVSAFPPRNPLRFLIWFVQVHTSHMFAYPAGGDRGASTMTTVAFAIGILALIRRGSKRLLVLLLSPFAMGLLAAFLGRYPYGGSARTMQYAAPSICLLGGLGLASLVSRMRTSAVRVGVESGLILLLAIVGLGMLGWDIGHPYKSPHDRTSRDFAQRFWAEQSRKAEVVCLRTDLDVPLDPRSWRNDRSALYLCHQAIYSARHRLHKPPEISRLTPSHPLVAVVFGEREGDVPAVTAWLRSMEPEYRLRSRKELVVNPGLRSMAGFFEDRYVLYELVPARAMAGHQDAPVRNPGGLLR